nr:VP2 [Tibet orbivirus]
MDEFSIALYPKAAVKHDGGVWKYPIIIENQNPRPKTGWNPRDQSQREGIWLANDEINTALRRSAPDDCAVLAPSYLDLMLEQLHRNSISGKRWEDVSFALNHKRTYDYQITHYDNSRFTGKCVFKSWGGDLHLDATYAESMVYDYYPIEDQCDHSFVNEWLNMYFSEVANVYQPAVYVLKDTQKYMIKAEVEWKTVEDQGLGRGADQKEEIKSVKPVQHVTYFDKLNRDHNFNFTSRKLRLMVIGNKDGFEKWELIMDKYTSILGVIREWNLSNNNVPYDKVCYWLSEIARRVSFIYETEEENAEISRRFQERMRANFTATDPESKKIRESSQDRNVVFSALILISACDAAQDKVTWETKHACCRGALLFAESILGDAYHYLRSTLSWSVRLKYYPNYKEEEKKQYIYRKASLFDPKIKKGMRIIMWNTKLVKPKHDLHINTGHLCEKFYEDEFDLYYWFNEEKYTDVISKVIDGDLLIKDVTHDSVFDDQVNIFKMDISKDAYLNEEGDLYLPPYMKKKIFCPMFLLYLEPDFLVLETEPQKDIWTQRVKEGFLVGVNEMANYCVKDKLSVAPGVAGESLKKNQEGTAYFDFLQTLWGKKGACKLEAVTKQNLTSLFRSILSVTKYLRSAEELMSKYKDKYTIDNVIWEEGDILDKFKNISQLFLYVLGHTAENKPYHFEEFEAQQLHQRIVEGHLEGVAAEHYPRLYEILSGRKKELVVGDLLWYNVVLAMIFTHRNIVLQQVTVHFFLFASEVRMYPVPARMVTLPLVLTLMKFHPGLVARKRALNEAEIIVARAMINHLRSNRICSIYNAVRTLDSKRMQFQIYSGSLCKGVTEMVYMVRAITYPRPGLLIVALSDDAVSPEVVRQRLYKNFRFQKASIMGIVVVTLRGDSSATCSATGVCSVKQVERNFMRLRHDVIIVKVRGCTLGNEELMSKIMNKGRI